MRIAVQTALLLPAFFVQSPVDPSSWVAGPIQHDELEIDDDCGPATIHLYEPRGGHDAALVISLGIDPAPPDDPAVVHFLTGLARSGVVAALVESPELDNGRLNACAPQLLTEAFQAVAAQKFVDAQRVGLLGFSVGGSLALIAAADPQISRQVRVVNAFGAYDSLTSLMQDVVTHRLAAEEGNPVWNPDELTLRMIRTNLIGGLPSSSDRLLLDQALPDANPPAPVDMAALSAQGRAAYELLTARNAASFAGALASLPDSQQAFLRALSPQAYVAQIQAPVYILADRYDSYVPVTESRSIDRELLEAGRQPHFTELGIFNHVEPTRGGNPLIVVQDVIRLYLHVDAVLGRLEQ